MGRWLSLYLTLLLHRVRRRSKPQILEPTHTHTHTHNHSHSRRRRRRRERSVNGMDDDEEERPVSKKRKLDDFELKMVIDDDDEDSHPARELEVVSATQGDDDDAGAVNVDFEGLREEFRAASDLELEERIRRNKTHLNSLSISLADKGAKLRLSIKKMEAEYERRKRDKDAYVLGNEPPSKPFNLSGAAAGPHQDTLLSHGKNHSLFFSEFNAKLEQSDNRATGSCNQPKRVSNGQLVSTREQILRDVPFRCPTNLASNKSNFTNVNSEGRGSISGSLLSQRSLPNRLIQKAAAPPDLNAVRTRKPQERTVVFLDDEDSELDDDDSPLDSDLHFDDMQRHFGNLEHQVSRISYPSRDDPAHVDIDFFDIKCLDPEVYLSSPIMNFYIRYLQQPVSPVDKSRCAFHFFNTFFYNKLKAAVSDKGNDSTSFAKFRRWWKGINLFHKAYILIPVHEDQHWSLIIICIPYKDKETGPIILHLDSLGLHNSQPIFENIKRFIRDEWEYLTLDGASSNLPWQKLPRRIEERTVTVPQQKNEYDCGLFVLYFMERFITEAPVRLSRRDLQMFSRQWFRPAEASDLRKNIRRLLVNEFKAAQQVQKDGTDSKKNDMIRQPCISKNLCLEDEQSSERLNS